MVDNNEKSLAEDMLRIGGKSEEEAKRTGAVDRADDDVEKFFAEQYRTANSPVHRAVWRRIKGSKFNSSPVENKHINEAFSRSIVTVQNYKQRGALYNEQDKLSDSLIDELGKAGYWGLLIDKEFGGQGLSVREFMDYLKRMSAYGEPTLAGMSSVHGCIGAVDPVRTFGNEEQKKRFLTKLASGESLSGFALTEPGAGSDLTAIKTTAVLDGDNYLLTGEKLFITNALPGRTMGVVCLVDGKPAVLIVELPKEHNENFEVVHYGLHALRRAHNNGLRFKNLPVPKENLLVPPHGDGLTIAYHGLNRGRVALCANASGVLRKMLKSIMPWAKYRETYGAAIETRELVKRRIARTAALIVGCDALETWCSTLLDEGYRGELECIIAKIFGSEAQKEVAIEYVMKTHGGRSFLVGHEFGDNLHDFLAPCIYEGEGEMLCMAFFKGLVKEHGLSFMAPIAKRLEICGLKTFNPINPVHVFKLRREIFNYSFWFLGQLFKLPERAKNMDKRLVKHAQFANNQLSKAALELSLIMVKHQLKLADRQVRMVELSQRIQDLIVMYVTCQYANQTPYDGVKMAAADVLCRDLTRKLTGKRISDSDIAAMRKLADYVIAGHFKEIEGVEETEILRRYK